MMAALWPVLSLNGLKNLLPFAAQCRYDCV